MQIKNNARQIANLRNPSFSHNKIINSVQGDFIKSSKIETKF